MSRTRILAAAAVIAAVAGVPATAAVASSARPGSQIMGAVTVIKDRPDSGDNGYWADDNYTRTVTITRKNAAPDSDCGTTAGPCWLWDFTIRDQGTFTTIAGQESPRTTTLLDRSVTGSMKGGTTDGSVYATTPVITSSPPQAENDHNAPPAGEHTTTNWVEQFFGSGIAFSSAANPGGPDLGADAGWTYRLNFGQDSQCPNDAYQWVDAAPDWGTGPANGNILAPDTADCT